MGIEKVPAKIDMLHGSLWDKLPRFALPVAATAILEQLFNASDIAIVGNFSSGDKTVAVAAVGANSPLIGLILNLFIGIALGANVVIANAIGRKDMRSVKKAVHTALIVAVLSGIVVTVIGELVAGKVMGLLHVPDDVFPEALLYLRIYLLGLPVIFLYNFEAAVFRSIGDAEDSIAGSIDFRRFERDSEPVLCHRAAYDRQRRGNCHSNCQRCQLFDFALETAAY
ncbi:MAG: MATE family efflux transporter [Ruminococcus callidus]